MYCVSLIKFLLECRTDLPVSILTVNTSNVAGVTHPVYHSPGGNREAKISGDDMRWPGRICHYNNGVNGTCRPKHRCLKEQRKLSGYNDVWNCPETTIQRRNQICCPDPGEESLLPGEGDVLSNLRKLCGTDFFFTVRYSRSNMYLPTPLIVRKLVHRWR